MEPTQPIESEEICETCGRRSAIDASPRALRIVAESPAMREVLRRAERFARAHAPVLVLGENGSGKELVARAIHAGSERAEGPFILVNVAAHPPELIDWELFGHAGVGVRNAHQGLFEAAQGGTLYFDEIAELPPALQGKLLRTLRDGEIRRIGEARPLAIDVRLVCASDRDLDLLVQQHAFRADLFHRIAVLTLRVPPLRERSEDILPLAREMLSDLGTFTLSPRASAALHAYRWPGNVRELDNALKHGAALADGEMIDEEALPDAVRRAVTSGAPSVRLVGLAEIEREHVLAVLRECRGAVVEAAEVLGIGRNTLWRKLKRWS